MLMVGRGGKKKSFEFNKEVRESQSDENRRKRTSEKNN